MLREVWIDIGIEKVDMHEGVTVKVLLDSGEWECLWTREWQQNMDLSCKN